MKFLNKILERKPKISTVRILEKLVQDFTKIIQELTRNDVLSNYECGRDIAKITSKQNSLIIQSLNINATPTPNLRPKIETLDLQLLVTNVTADLYGFNFLYRVEFSRVLIFAE